MFGSFLKTIIKRTLKKTFFKFEKNEMCSNQLKFCFYKNGSIINVGLLINIHLVNTLG